MSFEVLKAMFTLPNILMMNIGLAAGTVIGAMPGLNVIFAIAILLPITFGMDSLPGMYLMLASYCGATYGGSITAILINTPGTPNAAATTFDGYPMAQQGAIFDSEPCAILPGVPVLSDYGVEDLHVLTGLKWVAIRKDTPDEIVEFVKAELNKAIASEEYQNYLKSMGFLAEDAVFEIVSEEEMTQIVTDAGVVYRAIMEKVGMI